MALVKLLALLFPAGLYYCFSNLTDHNVFIILYGVTSVYFAGVMVSVKSCKFVHFNKHFLTILLDCLAKLA